MNAKTFGAIGVVLLGTGLLINLVRLAEMEKQVVKLGAYCDQTALANDRLEKQMLDGDQNIWTNTAALYDGIWQSLINIDAVRWGIYTNDRSWIVVGFSNHLQSLQQLANNQGRFDETMAIMASNQIGMCDAILNLYQRR